MSQKTEVPFREVLLGEGFISGRTKRHFSGLKIREIFDVRTIEFDGRLNAVILDDGYGNPVEDVGSLIFMRPETIVGVDRSEIASLTRESDGGGH